jgi:DNA-binding transcriptional regulator YhcF (GntR family)
MSKIEGLTMMEENINVLADLKGFNQKYQKYVKCTDITLPEMAKAACTKEDANIQTVNDAYNTLMDNGSIQKLRNAPLTNYISVEESKKNHNSIVKTHNEIIPLRKELDAKMNQLMDSENNVHDDYKKKYDNTMYSSLVLSVVLTSSLFFIFKKL